MCPDMDVFHYRDARGFSVRWEQGEIWVDVPGPGVEPQGDGKLLRPPTEKSYFISSFPRRVVVPESVYTCDDCGNQFEVWMTDLDVWKLAGRQKAKLCLNCFVEIAGTP